VVITRRCQRL